MIVLETTVLIIIVSKTSRLAEKIISIEKNNANDCKH